MTAREVCLALWVFVKGDIRMRDALLDLLVSNDSPRAVGERHGIAFQRLYEYRAEFLPLVRDGMGNAPDFAAMRGDLERPEYVQGEGAWD